LWTGGEQVTEEYKKEVLQCRNKECNHVFHQSEINRVHSNVGIDRINRACPKCGSNRLGLIDYPVDDETLLYKNHNT